MAFAVKATNGTANHVSVIHIKNLKLRLQTF